MRDGTLQKIKKFPPETLLALLISTGFTSGLWPWLIFRRLDKWGGVGGTLLGFAIMALGLRYGQWGWQTVSWCTLALFIAGWLAIPNAEEWVNWEFGLQQRHDKRWVESDFNFTSIDEVAGTLLASLPIFFFPALAAQHVLYLIAAAAVVFKIFDGIKPWPIRWVEHFFEQRYNRWAISFGIMADDAVAALFTWLPLLGWLFLF